jgi:hypothetical protein
MMDTTDGYIIHVEILAGLSGFFWGGGIYWDGTERASLLCVLCYVRS